MRKRNSVISFFTVLSMTLLLLAVSMPDALAADKLGWVGPVYTELAESLTRGFKDYYKKTYGKDIDITFVKPGGWPVCLEGKAVEGQTRCRHLLGCRRSGP